MNEKELLKYTAIMTLEDGKVFTEQSNKLSVAEHFYDCFVDNGKRGTQDFYVELRQGVRPIATFDGRHAL